MKNMFYIKLIQNLNDLFILENMNKVGNIPFNFTG
jgi:hypothetical protein